MKTYEKYLVSEKYQLDEGITASKALGKIEDAIKNASNTIELNLIKTMIVSFIKKFKSAYTDEVSLHIDNLLKDAQKRVK